MGSSFLRQKKGRWFAPFVAGTLALASLMAYASPAAAADQVSSDGVTFTGKPNHVTISITDSGFDKQSYNVYKYESPFKDFVTIVNNGTTVHTATVMPGNWSQWSFQEVCDAAYSNACSTSRASGHDRKGKQSGIFDTGGLAPGEAVQGAFVGNGAVRFTSSTDCLFGNKNPEFNCVPATINVKGIDSGSLADALNGTALIDSTDRFKCVHYIGVTDGGPPLCYQKGFTVGKTMGSEKNPISGSVTIHIDDIKGYDPAFVFVTPDTTVTWVNDSCCRAHGITKQGPTSDRKNGFDPLESPGIGPGQSWSYVPCSSQTTKICSHDWQYTDNTDLYQVPWDWAGNSGGGVSIGGEVTVVVPKS